MNRFLQAVLALCGLVISGLIGWQGYVNDRLQNKQAFMNVFSQQVIFAKEHCDQSTLQLAVDAAHEIDAVNGDKTYSTFLEKVIADTEACATANASTGTKRPPVTVSPPPAPATSGAPAAPPQAAPSVGAGGAPPPSPAPSMSAPPTSAASKPQVTTYQPSAERVAETTQNLQLQLREGVARAAPLNPLTQRSTDRWYAVLASYAVTSDQQRYVIDDFNRFSNDVKKSGLGARVEVYRTKISNHYAVVLTPTDGGRDDARSLVRTARERGWAPDAFVQNDRDWTKCDVPNTPEGLTACAK